MAEQPVADNLWQEFDLGPDYHAPVEVIIRATVVDMYGHKGPLGKPIRVMKCGCTPDRHLSWGHVGS